MNSKSLDNVISKNEKLINTYNSRYHLTTKRIIYLKKGINKHYKDISLSSIDSIEYTKKRYLWIIGSGLFVFLSSIILSLFLRDYIVYSLGTGFLILIVSIIVFIYFADKDVIIFAKNTQMDIQGVGMDFIRELRSACYSQNNNS